MHRIALHADVARPHRHRAAIVEFKIAFTLEAPVSPDCGSRGNAFSGTVKGVQLAIGDSAESSDHLVSPEDAIRIAMVRQ